MANRTCAAGIAAMVGFAILLLTPGELAARWGGAGFGGHPFLAAGPRFLGRTPVFHRSRALLHSRAFHHRALGVIGTGVLPYYYSGAIDDYDGGAVNDVGLLAGVNPPPPAPPPVVTCHHSEETVTVRSEDGGDRQVRISRC